MSILSSRSTRELVGFFPATSPEVFLRSNHATIGSIWKLKIKSGMNGHPISPFDTRICGGESPSFPPCFYSFKTHNCTLQTRLMKEKTSKKKNKKKLFGESSYLIPGDPWDPKMFLNDFFNF